MFMNVLSEPWTEVASRTAAWLSIITASAWEIPSRRRYPSDRFSLPAQLTPNCRISEQNSRSRCASSCYRLFISKPRRFSVGVVDCCFSRFLCLFFSLVLCLFFSCFIQLLPAAYSSCYFPPLGALLCFMESMGTWKGLLWAVFLTDGSYGFLLQILTRKKPAQ